MKGILNKAPVDMNEVVLVLVVEELFEVSKDANCLEPKQAKLFHHLMAKPLFLCKQVRPDLQTPVALTIRSLRAGSVTFMAHQI